MLLICSAVPMGKCSRHDTILAARDFDIMSVFLFIFEAIYYLIKFRQEGANPEKNIAQYRMIQKQIFKNHHQHFKNVFISIERFVI